VFYRWETSRAAACLDQIIPVDFTGTLQCDGYAAYPSFATGREAKIELADAGRMCGGNFTRPWINPRARRAGSCARSNTSIAWKRSCAKRKPDQNCESPYAHGKAALS